MRKMYFFTSSHHPAHAQSAIRAFALLWNCLQYPMILSAYSVGPDQTEWMRSLTDLGIRYPHMPGDTYSHDAVMMHES